MFLCLIFRYIIINDYFCNIGTWQIPIGKNIEAIQVLNRVLWGIIFITY